MSVIGDSLLLPLMLAGPLLIGCCWLLWVVVCRPFARPPGHTSPGRRPTWVVLPCLGLVAIIALAAVVVHAGETLYLRDINRANARTQALREVYSVLEHYQTDHGRPPSKAEDLDPYGAEHPAAVGRIRAGDVVVLWGRPVGGPSGGSVPVAHERLDARGKVRVAWSDGRVSREDAAGIARLVEQP